ncbi:hypothetical protein [Thiothrix sp.]|jgi:hypothetical protein|uniref:hypothetical protein n=1 Tax=Thiothrix sp. TaxID=1032 RepID=UPI00257960CB|nr:hypothetical protein [Thiothrix sp.]
MYLVLKNGKVLLESKSYPQACKMARMDAYRFRFSQYMIWDKAAWEDPAREKTAAPLYRIAGGVGYTIPALNRPANAA